MGHLHADLRPPFAIIAVVLTAGPPTPKPCGSNKISEELDLDSSHKSSSSQIDHRTLPCRVSEQLKTFEGRHGRPKPFLSA